MASERWRAVAGLGGKYEVSDHGRVRSLVGRYGAVKILTPSLRSKTSHYLSVRVSGRTRYVHELVAEAFLGARPDGMQINHKDTNKANCAADNLEYVTQLENIQHALANDLWPQVFKKKSA